MNDTEFLETVRQETPLESADDARTVTTATLQTLGERISDGEATDLARELPDEFARDLTNASPGEAEPFSLEECTERVSERAEIAESDVVEYSRGVTAALATVAEDELESAREQLPTEYDVLFEPGGPATEREFLETVRERGDLDSLEAARAATVGTIRTFGERLSAGQAADLSLFLPEPFADELTGSDDESATDYSFDEFVRRVSQRESVPEATAERHVRAVGSTLAETVSERELEATESQLPDRFRRAFDPPNG